MNTVIERVRAKYPEYAEVPDDELTQRIAQKYPDYLEVPDFKADVARIGRKESMQKEMGVLRTEGLADEIVSKVIGGAEAAVGVVADVAHLPVRVLQIPEQIAKMAGVESPPTATAPLVSPETAKKAVEFMTPGGAASEGSVGQAVQELVSGFASGATTPAMVAGMMAAPAAPVGIARVFQAEMLSHVPSGIKAAIEAPTGAEQTKSILATAANLVLPALIEKGITPTGAKEVMIKSAANVGPATEAVVKGGKEAVETPPERAVPTEAAPVESLKPAEAALPVSTEPPLVKPSTTVEVTQGAPVERITELRAPEAAQPEIVGMGAATPAEYSQTPQTPTGIKNRTVDVERAKRDLPPAMEAGKQSFGEAWDRAMAKMDKDPIYQERLIAELGDKPRAVTDIEDATLLHRQVDLQNEYGKATRAMAQAFDDGRMEDVAHEQARVAALSDQLYEIYTINQAVGTETGRGLAARKMMAYEDFTLAKMELEKRAAKGGEQLTLQERGQVVELQKKIEMTQKAYDDYVAKSQQQITALEMKAALAATTKKAQETISPKIKAIAERIVSNLEREADAAWKRIQERGLTFGSGPLHELPNIRDYAIIGASKAVKAGVDYAQWSASMLRQFGEGFKPFLERVWEESNKMLHSMEEMKPFAQEVPKRGQKTKLQQDPKASKLHFENAKAKKEWQEQLQEERRSHLPAAQKAFGMMVEAVNTARAIRTSADLSAVLRQGGKITIGHPLRALKIFPAMLRAFRSEANAHAANLEIASRPNYPLYLRSKLYLSEHGHALSKMEEAFMSRWAEKIPVVAGSQRAYTTFLNRLRADSFDAMEATLSRTGKATPEEAAHIANYINVATGRGRIGLKENAAVGMNTVFFAPRYVASRFQLIGGGVKALGDVATGFQFKPETARARKLVAKEYGRFLLGLGVVYGLGKLSGADIELDPRSSDFGKMRFGNTRIDPLAGIQQATVLLSRLGSGETKTLKGKVVPIRGDKVPYGSPDSADVIARFLRTKLSPVVGTSIDIATGENVVGEPVTAGSVAESLVVPLSFGDIKDALMEQGVPEGEAMALLSILGMGVQTYEDK